MAFRCIALLLSAVALAVFATPASAADETRQALVDAQHTNAVPDSPVQPPLRLRWQANLGTPVDQTVLITGGRVFYLRQPGTGLQLTALDAASGRELWSQALPARGFGGYGLAVDGGRLFLGHDASSQGSSDILVKALEPATGAMIWERRIESYYGLGSQLTVDRGQLFFVGSAASNSLHGLRQSDGGDLWAPISFGSGSDSTPAVDDRSVYVSFAGPRTSAYDRDSGAMRWEYRPCCTGGGGTTPRLHGGRLYANENLVHDPRNGTVVGRWSGVPSFAGDGGVELTSERLRGFGPGYDPTRWMYSDPESFRGIGSPPFIAGGHVYATQKDYELFALRASDGAPAWCQRLTPPPGSASSNGGGYVAAVAAGQGLLLVRNGYGLAAYESGGPPSSCAPPAEPGDGITPGTTTGGGPAALSLKVGRNALLLGERTNVTATLTGGGQAGGRRVVLDLDEWPFDGRFKPGASALTLADGTVAFKLAPRRNVAVRARLVDDPEVVSAPAREVYADFPFRVRTRGDGGRRPTITARVYAFPKARIRRKTVYAYLARGPRQAWRLVDRRRWQKLGKRSASVTLRYPRGRLTKRDTWLVCVREAKPDAFGRPQPVDRRCGARRMPRGAS